MIYSRDRRRGFYWFAPVKGPEEWGGMPPPVAFDRDILGDKPAWKAAKQAAKHFYRTVNFRGPRIKIYGSDFLVEGYVTDGDGIYFHPAWGTPDEEDDVDVIVDEILSMMDSSVEEARADGKIVAFNVEGIERDVIRPKVLLASYPGDGGVDERFVAAFNIMSGLKEQLDAATTDAEIEALEEHYADAKARYDREVDRLLEERGLADTVGQVVSRLSEHLTDDAEQAMGS